LAAPVSVNSSSKARKPEDVIPMDHEEFEDFKSGPEHVDEKPSSLSNLTEWDSSPENWITVKEIQDEISRQAPTLAPALKEAYYLRDIDGLSGSETAEILEITEEAVRVRLHRARKQIVSMVKSGLSARKSGRVRERTGAK